MKRKKVFIVGIVGVPANYGGFETLVEQLLDQWKECADMEITVFCSSRLVETKRDTYNGARLFYLPFPANGMWSVVYDIVGMLIACIQRADSVLVLGVSGGLAIPLVRVLSRSKVVVNLDGCEAGRAKWGRIASLFLKASTWVAKTTANQLIIDNAALAGVFKIRAGSNTAVITYGGDNALNPGTEPITPQTRQVIESLPGYGLAVARVVPENNVHLILQVVSQLEIPFVFVGNWQSSIYGLELREMYKGNGQIRLLDQQYAPADIFTLRFNARYYIHGHSAGGTNPSLVEMMFFPHPILAFDCEYNRITTKNRGHYFSDGSELKDLIQRIRSGGISSKTSLPQVARTNYVWSEIAQQYRKILCYV